MEEAVAINVPDMVGEEVDRLVRAYGRRVGAEELRRMLKIEPRYSVEISYLNVREKDRERIRWLDSTQA